MSHALWAVPVNCKELINKYGLKHIPHITLKDNLQHPSNSPLLIFRPNKVEFYNGLTRLGNHRAGYRCQTKGLGRDYDNRLMHMTMWYNFHGNYIDYLQPPESTELHICRAITEGDDPAEWYIA